MCCKILFHWEKTFTWIPVSAENLGREYLLLTDSHLC
jgi:hypothetical protein